MLPYKCVSLDVQCGWWPAQPHGPRGAGWHLMTGCKNSISETASAAFYCIKCIGTLLKKQNPSRSQKKTQWDQTGAGWAAECGWCGAGASLGGDPQWRTCLSNTWHKGWQPWVWRKLRESGITSPVRTMWCQGPLPGAAWPAPAPWQWLSLASGSVGFGGIMQ